MIQEKSALAPASTRDSRVMARDGSFKIRRIGEERRLGTDFYHFLLVLKWWQFLGIFVVAYLAINLVFALAYFLCGPEGLEGISQTDLSSRYLQDFFFSVQTFATIGYGRLVPVGLAANILVTIEALVGLLAVAVSTGLIFARVSKPTARVAFSDVAVITPVDGVPSLMIRLANRRMNQIVDARASVTLSYEEKTSEGQEYRNLYDLKLERDTSSAFALSWTVVHEITKDSKLHGLTLEQLRARDAIVIVTLVGIDETFNQTVHAK
ncbi:MAG: ATP-sensitive inward rectifier potassium channel 10 [Deltaproteobacteria bacterium]|nr:ATP-sensitive inward rectifier potassium channel 10 [Deltaproteobacteria bacterium]